VIHRAEDVARKILDTYLEPDKSFVELREMAIDGTSICCEASATRATTNSRTCGPCSFEVYPAVSICGQRCRRRRWP